MWLNYFIFIWCTLGELINLFDLAEQGDGSATSNWNNQIKVDKLTDIHKAPEDKIENTLKKSEQQKKFNRLSYIFLSLKFRKRLFISLFQEISIQWYIFCILYVWWTDQLDWFIVSLGDASFTSELKNQIRVERPENVQISSEEKIKNFWKESECQWRLLFFASTLISVTNHSISKY